MHRRACCRLVLLPPPLAWHILNTVIVIKSTLIALRSKAWGLRWGSRRLTKRSSRRRRCRRKRNAKLRRRRRHRRRRRRRQGLLRSMLRPSRHRPSTVASSLTSPSCSSPAESKVPLIVVPEPGCRPSSGHFRRLWATWHSKGERWGHGRPAAASESPPPSPKSPTQFV